MAAIATDGRVVVAGVGARKLYGFEGTSAVLAFLDADGELTALHTQSRIDDRSMRSATGPSYADVFVLEDAFLVRSWMSVDGNRHEQWVVYDLGGARRGALDAGHLMHGAVVETTPCRVAVIGSTNLFVSVWRSRAWESDEYVVAVHDAGAFFALNKQAADREPLWLERIEGDMAWPWLGEVESPEGSTLQLGFLRKCVVHGSRSFRVDEDGELVVAEIVEEDADSNE